LEEYHRWVGFVLNLLNLNEKINGKLLENNFPNPSEPPLPTGRQAFPKGEGNNFYFPIDGCLIC
jgi:hypothetical protein